MKKFWSLILCVVLVCTVLVGCGEEPIGGYIENYPVITETVERLDLNLYIITGDAMLENAKTSVATRIAGHTKTDYNTILNVKYVSAADYETTVANAIAAGGKDVPHIILINSEGMFNSLINAEGGNKLVDLTDYYKNREFGRLNTQISSALLEASKIDGRYYTVPNNRIIGEYTYVVINKAILYDYHYSNQEIASKNTIAAVEQFKAELKTNNPSMTDEQLASLVRLETGSYEKRYQLANEGFCNVVATPTVTTSDAFASAFAIVNTTYKHNDRAMKMIYAINNDAELRNLLQYGVQGANYVINNGDIVRVQDDKNTYQMNLDYTGDLFKAAYSSELGWVDGVYNYRLQHSKELTKELPAG